MHHRSPSIARLLALLGALPGCAVFQLEQQVEQIAAHGILAIQVEPRSTATNDYAVAWIDVDGHRETIDVQHVDRDGIARFLLRNGAGYGVGAWTDLDGDGTYEPGEPAGQLTMVEPVPLERTATLSRPLPLTLTPDGTLPVAAAFAASDRTSPHGEALAMHLGEVASLDDPAFSVGNGSLGMWQPFEFLREHGYGLYFLEPYDPRRLPVVLVHGLAASPQDWRTLVATLDPTRFQCWFLHYPSGLRLEKSANALAAALAMLQQRHGFDRLAIVGHSMGGLLAHGATTRLQALVPRNFVADLVTISAPWDGHAAAAEGVRKLPYPVPSWRDLEPGSDYLRSLVEHALPPDTRHALLFTYQSTTGVALPPDNDGKVGLASQLVPVFQERAASMFGRNLGHTEVLDDAATMRHVQAALDAARGRVDG
ncbi:MAG: alpha/beta fold hydrolase [Planctomycetes bacterium]|nr:alpha/beta fold hydrolase [Planctomycetota bacterium]